MLQRAVLHNDGGLRACPLCAGLTVSGLNDAGHQKRSYAGSQSGESNGSSTGDRVSIAACAMFTALLYTEVELPIK